MQESLKKVSRALPPVILVVMWAAFNFFNSNRYEDFNFGQAALYYISGGLVAGLLAALLLFFCRRYYKFMAILIFALAISFFLIAPAYHFLWNYIRWRFIVLGILALAIFLAKGRG